MIRKTTLCAVVGALVLGRVAPAAAADDAAVRKAMEDEMARSLTALHLGASPPPYHLSYAVVDTEATHVAARLGALSSDGHHADRALRVATRVGSPAEDNTNSRSYRGGSGAGTSLDDDYASIRRDLWLLSDGDYKRALEALAHKKGSQAVEEARRDKTPDFSAAPAVQSVKDHALPITDADRARLKTLVLGLSRLFRDFPAVNGGVADAHVEVVRRRLLTSDKTWTDERHSRVRLEVHADTVADDGQSLSSSLSFTAADVAGLPPLDKMEAEVRALARNLAEQRAAPAVEVGSATVLFDGPAAAEVASLLFAGPLSGQPVPRSAGESGGDGSASLADKLGLQVAPRWLTVTDDPGALGPGKRLLFGGYDTDDEGVAAEKVTLIDKGVVKGLFMSRTPRKEIPRSNGHGRGLYGAHASAGNLFVTATGGLDRAGLLAAAARSAGPKGTVYVVRQLAEGSGLGRGQTLQARVAFRYKDGKEEVVRGLSLEGFTPKKMKKDLIAAGKEPVVLDQETWGQPQSVVSPALLFEDVDVGRPNDKNKRPPLYPSPLAAGPR